VWIGQEWLDLRRPTDQSHSVRRPDVQNDSIDVTLAEASCDAHVRHLATVAGGSVAVTKALRRLISAGHEAA
jgi:hypothetical protein